VGLLPKPAAEVVGSFLEFRAMKLRCWVKIEWLEIPTRFENSYPGFSYLPVTQKCF
jgi:hypothetical protein